MFALQGERGRENKNSNLKISFPASVKKLSFQIFLSASHSYACAKHIKEKEPL